MKKSSVKVKPTFAWGYQSSEGKFFPEAFPSRTAAREYLTHSGEVGNDYKVVKVKIVSA